MRLVGMLDSPYVRRVAITATLLGLELDHASISVFRQADQFRAVNPLIKAPSLVCDDGTVLTDSTLIIQHFEDVSGRSLRPVEPGERRVDLSLTGIAIVAADKAVAIEYERKRPEPSRFQPWLDRIGDQLDTAFDLLDRAARNGRLAARDRPQQAAIAAATAWGFTRYTVSDRADADRWPDLSAFAAACEALPAFRFWPIDRT